MHNFMGIGLFRMKVALLKSGLSSTAHTFFVTIDLEFLAVFIQKYTQNPHTSSKHINFSESSKSIQWSFFLVHVQNNCKIKLKSADIVQIMLRHNLIIISCKTSVSLPFSCMFLGLPSFDFSQ